MKKPAAKNIGIDIDPKIIDIWSNAHYPTKDITSQNLAILKADFLETTLWECMEASTYLFLDPTYPKDYIKGKLNYDFWLSDNQHKQLLSRIRGFKCMIGITTYENPIYEKYLHDWRKIQFKSQTRRGTATETMYMNYPEPNPLQLHDPTWQSDPTYTGTHKWRGREGQERRHFNFVRKLQEMNDTEQSLLFHALREQFPELQIPDPTSLFSARVAEKKIIAEGSQKVAM